MGRPLPGKLHAAGRGLVCLSLCGLLGLLAVPPALAAAHRGTTRFMVSVQVVRPCQYQIRNQPQKPSVVHVVMNNCSGRPTVAARGFATSGRQYLASRDKTRYLLRETGNAATGNRYIEIDF